MFYGSLKLVSHVTASYHSVLRVILCGILEQGLYSRDVGNYEIGEEDYQFHSALSDVSHQILDIGTKLELSYPSLYVDLPRQLNMPLRSQVVVVFVVVF